MFEMLDYRAHKLYFVLFGIPFFIIRWLVIIGLPLAAYDTGIHLSQERIFQIIITVISLLIYELIAQISVQFLDKLFIFIFNLFIDVIPAEKRTKEEALIVVRGGERARENLRISKIHPKDWKDEDLFLFQKGFFTWFFKKNAQARFNKIREHFSKNKSMVANEYTVNKILKENNMDVSIYEKIICNPILRGMAIEYSIVLYLILFNPSV